MAEGSAGVGPQSIKAVLIVPVVLITMVAGGALALVNAATVDRIAESKANEKKEALAAVMPPFANDPTTRIVPVDLDPEADDGDELIFYAGLDAGDRITGWGVESRTDTAYSGDLSLVFGVDSAGKIQSARVLEQRETPGLGTKAAGDDFLDAYEGRSLGSFDFRVRKDGGQIDAISGATISSRAVTLCIRQGLEEFGAVAARGVPAESGGGGASDE
jgi:electron transport complex protein RnfG